LTFLDGCARLAMATPFVQALDVLPGCSKASSALKSGVRQWWLLLNLVLVLNSQENPQKLELKYTLRFRIFG
jgi:hypothetical protein